MKEFFCKRRIAVNYAALIEMWNSLIFQIRAWRKVVESHKIARRVILVILLAIEFLIYLLVNQEFNFNIISFFLPSGIVSAFTYYILSPFFVLLYAYIKEKFSYKSLINDIDTSISAIKKWLFSQKLYWAPHAGASDRSDIRIANMLEIGLALESLDLSRGERKKLGAVSKALWDEKSDMGWYSKTLGNTPGQETVICTSWGLYYFKDKGFDKVEFLQRALNNLWNAHTEYGWGLYVKNHPQSECRTGNTFHALRVINCFLSHNFEDDKDNIKDFIVDYYRKSKSGLFGFHLGDDDNLCATAMYYILYKELNLEIRKEINNYYNSKAVITYIIKKFCEEDIQCIEEDLPGTTKVDKVPWQHITASYALSAISHAWKDGELNIFQKATIVKHIKKMIATNLYGSDTDKYYHPRGMPRCAKTYSAGAYTFPSAHLIIGLREIKKAINNNH